MKIGQVDKNFIRLLKTYISQPKYGSHGCVLHMREYTFEKCMCNIDEKWFFVDI